MIFLELHNSANVGFEQELISEKYIVDRNNVREIFYLMKQ